MNLSFSEKPGFGQAKRRELRAQVRFAKGITS
jgi:hypothetical protein